MKARYLIILITILISSTGFSQEKQVLKAFYLGYDKEYKTYSFEDADGSSIEFTEVKADVLKQYDLISPKLIGKAFEIIYLIKENDDDEEYIIISMKPTELKKNENSDDEEDEEDEE